MTGYESKKAMARNKLLELAQEGMNMHSHDAPEYIVCEALIEALAQPAQEPVDELKALGDLLQHEVDRLIAAKPQRTWVDLTDDEEIADYLGDEYHTMTESDLRFFMLGVAAAKEKNNGT
jgi:hypothetical protein